MKDIIYREDAVSRITAEQKEEQDIDCIYIYSRCKTIIKHMPSAEKTGKWIWENYVWHCDQCGKNPTYGMGYVQRKEELFDFCPHCGVRMVKE